MTDEQTHNSGRRPTKPHVEGRYRSGMLKPALLSLSLTLVAACTQALGENDDVDGVDDDDGLALSARCAANAGGVLEEDNPCVTLGGPSRFLRAVDGGSDGGHVWTGTTSNSGMTNYADYGVNLLEGGRYLVSAYVSDATATTATYRVSHDGRTDVVTLNQAGKNGFVDVGTFEFAAGANQKIVVGDNTGVRGQRLVFDALRLQKETAPSSSSPPPAASCARVEMTADINVRPSASTSREPLGQLRDGDVVNRLATVEGQDVQGNREWHKVPFGNQQGYVAAAYARCLETQNPGPPPSSSSDPMRAALENAGVSAVVAERAITAYRAALAQDLTDSPVFTVIDFSQPSTTKRWITVNLTTGAVLLRERVAHGSGSGSSSSAAMASSFSNEDGTHKSSLGLARTAETYNGSKGYSLRLDGLEPSNDAMRARAIVVHGADYVEDSFVSSNGYAGRSWGCPAVAASHARNVVDVIKQGTLVFSYFNDARWLSSSPFLSE
jgi:hypothetical protein